MKHSYPSFSILPEGGPENLLGGQVVVADWLDVCLDQPVSCRGEEDHLVGLSLLFLLH